MRFIAAPPQIPRCARDKTWKLEQHHLRRWQPHDPVPPHAAPEQQKEVPADPLLRFAVVPEFPLMRMKAPVVIRAQKVVQIFVMNYRLYKECWNIMCV